eukprot:1123824-Alexandrium_andersonii.AAC.1
MKTPLRGILERAQQRPKKAKEQLHRDSPLSQRPALPAPGPLPLWGVELKARAAARRAAPRPPRRRWRPAARCHGTRELLARR